MALRIRRECLILLCAALAGCGTPPVKTSRFYGSPALKAEWSGLLKQPFSDTQSLDVIYVTNRNAAGDPSECDNAAFGTTPSDKMSYGTCTLNIPKRHHIGGFEVAATPRADSHQYYRTLSHAPLTEDALLERLKQQPGSDLLVFVHGFNVKFQEAVLRTAQIA
ncbi:MAG: alpha/beta hydrolase, partial [Elusimicrobiota bacterium]